jgi:hypothetical protein
LSTSSAAEGSAATEQEGVSASNVLEAPTPGIVTAIDEQQRLRYEQAQDELQDEATKKQRE